MSNEKSGRNSETTFFFSREVEAPRELLFDVWTKKEHIEKWFGPVGSKIVGCSNDLRPGGIMHYGMEFETGFLMWGRWVYREIIPPEKLSFIVSFSDENKGVTRHPGAETWPAETLTEIIFEERDGKTLMTMTSYPVNASEEEIKLFSDEHNSMDEGWGGTFMQLKEYLALLQNQANEE